MITNSEKPSTMIPGLRKAAILMVVLGEQVGASIMSLLSEEEATALGREIARLPTVSADQAEGVLEEGYQIVLAHDYVLKGGVDYARKLLMNAYGPERQKSLRPAHEGYRQRRGFL